MATKRERQRKLAREAHQRRLERNAQRARRAKQWSVIAIAVVLVGAVGVGIAAIGGVFSPAKSSQAKAASVTPSVTATPSATPSPSSTPAMVNGKCIYTAGGTASRKVSLPPATPDTAAKYTATIKTNRGAIVVDLLGSKAPCTVNSFVSLADQKFYDKTPCPRLSNSQGLYILQCGDPTGTGSGGPGYEFNSENLAGATYPAGTLAMANGGPGTNGSQFFLVFQTTTLAPSYTPFGQVVSGLDILQNVGKRGFGPPVSPYGGGAPKESVQIESVTISKT